MVVLAGVGSGIRNFTPQINLSPNQLLLPLGILSAAGILVGILSVRKRRTPKSENLEVGGLKSECPKSETSESGM